MTHGRCPLFAPGGSRFFLVHYIIIVYIYIVPVIGMRRRMRHLRRTYTANYETRRRRRRRMRLWRRDSPIASSDSLDPCVVQYECSALIGALPNSASVIRRSCNTTWEFDRPLPPISQSDASSVALSASPKSCENTSTDVKHYTYLYWYSIMTHYIHLKLLNQFKHRSFRTKMVLYGKTWHFQ